MAVIVPCVHVTQLSTPPRTPPVDQDEIRLGGDQQRVVSPFNRLLDGDELGGRAPAAKGGHGGGHGHGHGHGGPTAPITQATKIWFGMGFAIETMFDVASDTLLAKYYSGAVRGGC